MTFCFFRHLLFGSSSRVACSRLAGLIWFISLCVVDLSFSLCACSTDFFRRRSGFLSFGNDGASGTLSLVSSSLCGSFRELLVSGLCSHASQSFSGKFRQQLVFFVVIPSLTSFCDPGAPMPFSGLFDIPSAHCCQRRFGPACPWLCNSRLN